MLRIGGVSSSYYKHNTCSRLLVNINAELDLATQWDRFLVQASIRLGRKDEEQIAKQKQSEREMDLIISYNRFWWLTSNTNHVD